MNYKTGEEILEMNLPKQKFLIDQILPKGVVLLAGSPKIGKSWFVLQMAVSISNGISFLNFNTSQAKVLYLSLEDTFQRLQNRLIDYDDYELENVHFITESRSLKSGLIEDIELYLDGNPSTKLIIIDTLQKIRDVRGDGYSYGLDYKDISILTKLSNKKNITMIIVHHLRKMKSEDSFEEISGTTGLTGAVDAMYVMKKQKNNDVVLEATGRDIETFDLKIRFNKENHQWELIHKSLEDFIEDEAILKVIEFMNTHHEFKGSATRLSELLMENFKYEISNSSLARKLRKFDWVLEDNDIDFEHHRTGSQRLLYLKKSSGSYDVNDGSDTKMTQI